MTRTMKLWTLVAVAALFAAVVGAGCAAPPESQDEGGSGGGDQASQEGDEEQRVQGDGPEIAMVTINLEALFFTEMVAGAEQAAEEANASLTVFNANDEPAAQNNAIQNYVEQGVDAITVVAIDTEGIQPAIEDAEEAGIPVVAIDAVVDNPAVDAQIGVDNSDAAAQMGSYFNDWAEEQDIESAQIGLVSALNSTIQITREDAFEETVQEAGHEIVQVVDGENQQEQAQQAAENLFTANPNMDAVYSTGEPALIGTVAAARSQDATGIPQFGWDLSAQAIRGIDDGFVEAVVQQDPRAEGETAVQFSVDLVQGNEVPETENIPITIATDENVDQFRSLFE
ncbi:substrate-binding domain-containing protein [Rubrobacter aplysinae]|uniref:substrate-binding domain-containing protein n=1 Tax=Rubrobacter aplysinae TaxID=909625 RepID=UPI00069E5DE1|nr:substrate-binding domain-containing protein [Rubrobacter aplysinae]